MLIVSLLVGVLGFCPAQAPAADQVKPVAVMSFSGYDQLFGDIEFVGKLSNNPDLAKGLEAMLKFATQSRGLEGLDKTKPWGAVVLPDGDDVAVYGFVPVTDLKKLLAVLEPFVGKAEETDGGVIKIKTDDKPLFVKQKGKWAVVVDKAERLKQMPTASLGEISKLNKQYDLALRIYIENIPAALKD